MSTCQGAVGAGERETVLVVDDDEYMRRLIARTLSSRYRTLEAPGVAAGLEVLAREPVDLVVMDVMMPGLDGFEGCRRVKAQAKGYLPVLLLTALGEQEDRNAGLEAGADDFLTKPADRYELELRVGTFLKLRRQERQIQRQLAELREVVSLKDELVSLLVHDLRNPLSAMFSALHLLQDSVTEPEAREDLRLGLDSAAKIRDLVDDLMQVRLLEEGKLKLAVEPADLGEVVRAAVETVRPQAQERRVALDVTTPAGVSLPLDRKLVRRAVENLLSNAMKYTRGRVEVSVVPGASCAEVRVGDTGTGIPEAYKPALFEKFGSVEARQGNARRGIGLGLYMVRLVAAAHGGSVSAEDRVGGGTVFRLHLGAAA